ncbi:MAG TPA: hypothetical protein VF114_02640 [Candidatus Limnocylindria bacterium]
MSDPFDGAGEPYKQSSYRALILLIIAVIIGMIVLGLFIGGAFDSAR